MNIVNSSETTISKKNLVQPESSLVEEFLRIEPEWAISRWTFFSRSCIFVWIIVFLIFSIYQILIFTAFTHWAQSLYFFLVGWSILLCYRIATVLAVKRARDAGWNWLIARIITSILFLSPIMQAIIPMIFTDVSTDTSSREFWGNFPTLLYDIVGVLFIWWVFLNIILFIVLMVASGKNDVITPDDIHDESDSYHAQRGKWLLWFFRRDKSTWDGVIDKEHK